MYQIINHREYFLYKRGNKYYIRVELEVEHQLFGEKNLEILSECFSIPVVYSMARENSGDNKAKFIWCIIFKDVGDSFETAEEELFVLAKLVEFLK